MKKKPKMKEKGFFTQSELENGFYQFVIDHSVPYEKSLYKSRFSFVDKNDLIRRVYARATFNYRIKDESYIEKELDKNINFYDYLKKQNDLDKEYRKKLSKLKMNGVIGKVKYFIIISMNQMVNKLKKRWV